MTAPPIPYIKAGIFADFEIDDYHYPAATV